MPTTTEHAARPGERDIRRIVYTAEEIAERVAAMGREISEAYDPDDDLLVLGLLKGSFIFLADLVRHIEVPLQVDFLVAASYGADQVSSGDVRLLYDPEADLEGRAVVVVEDIVDSGTTLARVVPLLESRRPRSLEICVLLHKRLKKLEPEPRWVGFDAPREFLVGYGLDYSEHFRHLPYIASI
ncbi:MAG TPA: hypoxanthine phosphoribosyltransferase [Longimicrobiales bacterium]|nr:hypoxanthine phosphoribosyltransferase [Longimicrobiales bacterium]